MAIQTKTETVRELAETVTERGSPRALMLRVAAGHVYARLKGTRDPWVIVSIAGALRRAQTQAAGMPEGRVLGMAARGKYRR